MVRHFFRGQFTDDARDSFREQQGKLGKKSRVVGATQFAQIPILNASQLVARWKLETPPALVSETQQLPIDGLSSGVYLIEATDGTYKAYTVAMVTSIAVVERTVNGQADLYVADRKTGAPVEKADVALWADGNMQSSGATNSDGMAQLTMTVRGGAQGRGAGERVDPGAARSRCGAGDAVELRLRAAESATTGWRISTRTGPCIGRDIRCTSRRSCACKKDDTLQLPQGWTPTLQVTDSNSKTMFHEGYCSFRARNADGGSRPGQAMPRWGTTASAWAIRGSEGGGSFYVEEYKKPEYQVTVKVPVTHLLQGSPIQANIEAKYFFGEPVAGAKVKYVVHTSTHYWWDEDQDDAGGDDAEAGDRMRPTTQTARGARPSSRSTRACSMRTAG